MQKSTHSVHNIHSHLIVVVRYRKNITAQGGDKS